MGIVKHQHQIIPHLLPKEKVAANKYLANHNNIPNPSYSMKIKHLNLYAQSELVI